VEAIGVAAQQIPRGSDTRSPGRDCHRTDRVGEGLGQHPTEKRARGGPTDGVDHAARVTVLDLLLSLLRRKTGSRR
jgi:hypothetical protein